MSFDFPAVSASFDFLLFSERVTGWVLKISSGAAFEDRPVSDFLGLPEDRVPVSRALKAARFASSGPTR